MAPPDIGTRWMLRSGDHQGQIVTVERVTTRSVYVRPESGGASMGKPKVAGLGRIQVDLDVFDRRYLSVNGLATDQRAARAYRRVAQPRPVAAETQPPPPPPTAPEPKELLSLEIMSIGPALAQTWLDRGGSNRPRRPAHVLRLSGAMQRGEWQLNGEAIKLDAAGAVRDGQHRLLAVVASGVTIQSVVVRNVTEPGYDVMDSGRPRAISDILGIHGYPSRIATASAARLLVFWETYESFVPHRNVRTSSISAPRTLAYLAEHPEVHEAVKLGDVLRSAGLMGGTGLWGALLALLLRANRERALEFHHLLATGEGLGAGHPALVLRRRVIGAKTYWTRNDEARVELAAMVIKSWNAFLEGQTIQVLSYRPEGRRPETFPKIKTGAEEQQLGLEA